MQITENLPPSDMEKALRTLESNYGITITIHDLYGKLLSEKRTRPSLIDYSRHVHAFEGCRMTRRTLIGEKTCYGECFNEVEGTLKNSSASFCKICWRHLVELVVPICYEGVHELTMIAGIFRDPAGPPPDSTPKFLELFQNLAPADPALFAEIEPLIKSIGLCLIIQSVEQEISFPPEKRRIAEILKFIRANMYRELHLRDLAYEMNLSVSRMSAVVKAETGMTFPELLAKERITRAALMLSETDHSLAEIAESTGFKNVYYFSTIFTRKIGVPPGKFRMNHIRK